MSPCSFTILLSIICNLYRLDSRVTEQPEQQRQRRRRRCQTKTTNIFIYVFAADAAYAIEFQEPKEVVHISYTLNCNKRHTHKHTKRTIICLWLWLVVGWCTRCTFDWTPARCALCRTNNSILHLFAIDFPIAENWLRQLLRERQWRPLNKTTTCPGFIFYLIHSRHRHRRRRDSCSQFHCFRTQYTHADAGCSLLRSTSSQYLISVLIYSLIAACILYVL